MNFPTSGHWKGPPAPCPGLYILLHMHRPTRESLKSILYAIGENLILTSEISQALLVMMIAPKLGTQSPKWIQILASVNSPNVGHLKLFHLETMQ